MKIRTPKGFIVGIDCNNDVGNYYIFTNDEAYQKIIDTELGYSAFSTDKAEITKIFNAWVDSHPELIKN